VLGCIVVLVSPSLIRFVIAEALSDRILHEYHDTYVVVGRSWWALELAAIFGFFAAWYYLFPKVSGYAYSDRLGKVHFWLSFIGFITMFVPQVILVAAIVGRVEDASDPFRHSNLTSSIGGYFFAAGFLVFFANMALSLLRRRRAAE
jgi:cytochrome c oxidase subunit 1